MSIQQNYKYPFYQIISKPIKNLEDMFAVLTDKEKLDTVLQIGLDKEYLQYKDKLVEFFIALKVTLEEKI